jgi:hypothetical protein
MDRFAREWDTLKKYPSILGGILIGLVIQYFGLVARNYAYLLAKDRHVYGGETTRLVDPGRDLVVSLVGDLSSIPRNIFLYIMAGVASFIITSVFWTSFIIRDSNVRYVGIIWRGFMVASICVVAHSVAILTTIIPSPSPNCSEENFKAPSNSRELFVTLNLDGGCGESIMSSHLLYLIIAALIVSYYCSRGSPNRVMQTCLIMMVWGLVIAHALQTITLAQKYSVDVWLSVCFALSAWIAFSAYVPVDPCSYQRGTTEIASEEVESLIKSSNAGSRATIDNL